MIVNQTVKCRVTPRHALPATYMFHTVGPSPRTIFKKKNPHGRATQGVPELLSLLSECDTHIARCQDSDSLLNINSRDFWFPCRARCLSDVQHSEIIWLDADPGHSVAAVFNNAFPESDHEIEKKVILRCCPAHFRRKEVRVRVELVTPYKRWEVLWMFSRVWLPEWIKHHCFFTKHRNYLYLYLVLEYVSSDSKSYGAGLLERGRK